ncbi:MAG: hypothetical protein LBR68_02170 [Lachnoclostridium sp.]|jgi:hypothetical protein|nr:hypothetical protein [Lachnoclostridium sp.]
MSIKKEIPRRNVSQGGKESSASSKYQQKREPLKPSEKIPVQKVTYGKNVSR